MPLPDPPVYTVPQIEQSAQHLLMDRLDGQISIPVDVDYLLESIDGVVLDYIPSVKFGHRVEGMVLRDVGNDELIVLVDEHLADTQPNRYRFTIAEELGHIELHRNVINQICSQADFRELHNHSRWHAMDRNARRFAAAVLMPPAAIAEEAREVYKKMLSAEIGLDLTANGVLTVMARVMAQKFRVSHATMKHRLGEWPMKIAERVQESLQGQLGYLA